MILRVADQLRGPRHGELNAQSRLVARGFNSPRLVTEILLTGESAPALVSALAGKGTVRLVVERPLSGAADEAEWICEPVHLSTAAEDGPRPSGDRRVPNWTGR
jgi:hypothetical protein